MEMFFNKASERYFYMKHYVFSVIEWQSWTIMRISAANNSHVFESSV